MSKFFTLTALTLCLFQAALPLSASAQALPTPLRGAKAIESVELLDGGTLVADAKTAVVHVRLLDRNGAPASSGSNVIARILEGDAEFDLRAQDASATGYVTAPTTRDRAIFLRIGEGGRVSIPIRPGLKAGSLKVRLEQGPVSRELDLTVVPAARAPMVVGLVTVGAGPVPGSLESTATSPNGSNTRRGRIALFATGQISRGTSATFAYNTADRLNQTPASGPYLENSNDRPFPIYGDSSTRRADALSRDHLFARIENGANSAMWGEYYVQAAPDKAIGGYNRLVDGAQLHLQSGPVALTSFLAKNDTAFDRQVLTPTGLSVLGQAFHPNMVVGSDTVRLVHLDRRSGAIRSQQILQRNVDYTVDYASGLFRFINIVLPYDSDFNPQQIVVQYEYEGANSATRAFGNVLNLKLSADGQNHADFWYINDVTGAGNLSLIGQAYAGTMKGGSWNISHEQSNGYLPTTQASYGSAGDAYTASLYTASGPSKFKLDFTHTTVGYNNPYGSYVTPGLNSLTASWSLKLSSKADLSLNYLSATNNLPATSVSQAIFNTQEQVGVKLHVRSSDRFAYHLGVQSNSASGNGALNPSYLYSGNFDSQSAPNPAAGTAGPLTAYAAGDGHSVNAEAGFKWQFSPRASLSLDRIMPLTSSFDPYNPAETRAELDFDSESGSHAFIRQLWTRTSIQALAATQASQTYASTARSATSIGFSRQIGGATWESGYTVDHTANGTDLYDAIGVRQRLTPNKRLSGDAFFQMGQSLLQTQTSGGSPYFFVLGSSLSYALPSFHATGQVQLRSGYQSGTTFQLGAAGKISPDVSLFANTNGSYVTGSYNNETSIGMSYRPSRNDRYLTLLSLNSRTGNIPNYDSYSTNVLELQQLYRAGSRTELAGSLAYKLTGDSFFAPRSIIYGLRADQRIGSRFDIGSELHASSIRGTANASATGLALEAGWRATSQMRFAAGFNFSNFANSDSSGGPSHHGFYITFSSYVDRILGWGKDKQ